MSRLGPEREQQLQLTFQVRGEADGPARINARLLDNFKGQTVRLTAKVIKLSGDTATVEAADGGQVGLHLSRDMHLTDGYWEIIGSVRDDKTVRALTAIELGQTLDMKAVNAVVEFANSSKGEGVLA